jgi:hypothetical protein
MTPSEKGFIQKRFGDDWWYECAMTVANRIPDGHEREKALVLTKLEEAMHWEQAARS